MVNRSSDYGNGRADSTDRQSQKTNTMTLSGVVSPDIQIQSMEHELASISMGFEPQRLLAAGGSAGNTTKGGKVLNMPYGGQMEQMQS